MATSAARVELQRKTFPFSFFCGLFDIELFSALAKSKKQKKETDEKGKKLQLFHVLFYVHQHRRVVSC